MTNSCWKTPTNEGLVGISHGPETGHMTFFMKSRVQKSWCGRKFKMSPIKTTSLWISNLLPSIFLLLRSQLFWAFHGAQTFAREWFHEQDGNKRHHQHRFWTVRTVGTAKRARSLTRMFRAIATGNSFPSSSGLSLELCWEHECAKPLSYKPVRSCSIYDSISKRRTMTIDFKYADLNHGKVWDGPETSFW